MNNEIKEILDLLNFNRDTILNGICRVEDFMLREQIIKLLDYITNLQEENERLHTRIKTIKRRRKSQTAKMRKYREEITNKQNSIVDYKSRCEKTIEYIKGNIVDIEFMKKEYNERTLKRFDIETTFIDIENLLNILQGENNESKN